MKTSLLILSFFVISLTVISHKASAQTAVCTGFIDTFSSSDLTENWEITETNGGNVEVTNGRIIMQNTNTQSATNIISNQLYDGDFEVSVDLVDLDSVVGTEGQFARAWLNIGDQIQPTPQFAQIGWMKEPTGSRVWFNSQQARGGRSISIPENSTVSLKIQRIDNTIRTFISIDDAEYEQITTVEVTDIRPSIIAIGHSNIEGTINQNTSATFDDIEVICLTDEIVTVEEEDSNSDTTLNTTTSTTQNTQDNSLLYVVLAIAVVLFVVNLIVLVIFVNSRKKQQVLQTSTYTTTTPSI